MKVNITVDVPAGGMARAFEDELREAAYNRASILIKVPSGNAHYVQIIDVEEAP